MSPCAQLGNPRKTKSMSQSPIYNITAIGRPLDPQYASNKWVLLLMPLAGAISGGAKYLQGGAIAEIAIAFLVGALVVFTSWALGRELAPDDNPTAFVSMGLAFVSLWMIESASLLLLAVALFLVRIVNRSTGLTPKLSDSIAVTALTLWAIYATHAAMLGAIGALAFFLDAFLRDGKTRQFAFAVLCLAGTGLFIYQNGYGPAGNEFYSSLTAKLVAGVGVLYLGTIIFMRRLQSVGDIDCAPLSLARVRGGMLIGLLVAAQALYTGVDGINSAAYLWATLAGIVIGGANRLFRAR